LLNAGGHPVLGLGNSGKINTNGQAGSANASFILPQQQFVKALIQKRPGKCLAAFIFLRQNLISCL
jgi:hypothetical protein